MGLEVVGVGVVPELIGQDARMPFDDKGEGQPIPVVINRRLLELYNKVFAPQRGLPQLTDSMLIGFQIPLELGRSYVSGKTLPNAQESAMQLVGFSDLATLAGASLPLSAVPRINRRFGADADPYSNVRFSAPRSEDGPAVAAGGERVGRGRGEAQRTRPPRSAPPVH